MLGFSLLGDRGLLKTTVAKLSYLYSSKFQSSFPQVAVAFLKEHRWEVDVAATLFDTPETWARLRAAGREVEQGPVGLEARRRSLWRPCRCIFRHYSVSCLML